MTPNELRLAAHLLRMGAAEFGNHGCNDMDWPDWFPRRERGPLVRRMHEANGNDPADLADSLHMYAERTWSPPDYWLMRHLADELEAEGIAAEVSP